MQRELGNISVSINTSYPIETMQSPRYRPKIDFVYINLDTVIRNFYASMKAVDQESLDLGTALSMLLDELRIIHTTLTTEHFFYYQDPKEIEFMFPHASRRVPRTDKQIMAASRMRIVTEHLLYELCINKDPNVEGLYRGAVPLLRIKKKLPPRMVPTAVLTHYPHQLLKRFDFPVLYLLESRTGKVKSFEEFSSKLNGVKQDDPIPFNAYTLQLMGDTALFAGVSSKLKKELRAMGEKRKWSSITSPAKFTSDIQSYGSPELKEACTSISIVRI